MFSKYTQRLECREIKIQQKYVRVASSQKEDAHVTIGLTYNKHNLTTPCKNKQQIFITFLDLGRKNSLQVQRSMEKSILNDKRKK